MQSQFRIAACLATVIMCAACGCSASGGISGNVHYPMTVTATTGMIADVAQVVGGEHVAVTGLMGPGVDPHLYKATQGDIRKLSEADVIFYNGLHLEGKMADILVRMAQRVRTVQVTQDIPEERLREPPEYEGQYDPHVWFDVSLWAHVVDTIRDTYTELTPQYAGDFEANAAAYKEELDELDRYIRERIAEIPEESRVLITAHDAFGYFGEAYGMEVMGLQGISTAAEFGLSDRARLVDIIVSRRIKAIFAETSIPHRSIEALISDARARGHEVLIGGELYSDALGAEDTPAGTYLGMTRHNVDTIVNALR